MGEPNELVSICRGRNLLPPTSEE